jgi:protoporphyrinogen oxidase
LSRLAILGAGVSGLAAGLVTGAPVFEQSEFPGGICRSYYLRPAQVVPSMRRPVADDAYRFEVGGGHWIFGGDPEVLSFIESLAPLREYERRAVVRLGETTVPYPLQDNVHLLDAGIAARSAHEQASAGSHDQAIARSGSSSTLSEWLESEFGHSLCRLFFHPFNDRYTAGLASRVAAQDGFKSPHPLGRRRRSGDGVRPPERGYNATFSYPIDGLDRLADAMASQCDVRYGRRVVAIDTAARRLTFADGGEESYDEVVCTLPLSDVVGLAGIDAGSEPDPHTSVLVLNIGAVRGPSCPDAHWQYEADSHSGFHRVGFYSNVDESFLPSGVRGRGSHVALYVERAYAPSAAPAADEVGRFAEDVVAELRARGYLGEVEVLDASWVEVAYTWRLPGSKWREDAISALEARGVHMLGRYGGWQFQGIADSIRDGLAVGSSFDGISVREMTAVARTRSA